MRALIIYASHEGQTERIVRRISESLVECGIPNDTLNVNTDPSDEIAVNAYDAVIVGAPVHMGRYDSGIRECVEAHHSFLSAVPSAFFSVSLGIVSENEEDRRQACKLADDFLDNLRWMPAMKQDFAGALRNSRYGWIKRRLMHWIAKSSGAETDLDHDFEYTDWDAVEEFAVRFAELAQSYSEPKQRKPTLSWSLHRIPRYSVN